MVAASLIDENRFSYSLNALSYDYLNKAKSEKGLVEAAKAFGVDPKAEMWKLPACYVGPYAETDPELTLELYHALKIVMEKNHIDILFDLEMDLLPILVEMTLRGIRVDVEKAEKVKQELLGKEKKYNARIKELAGFTVDIWSGDLIAKAMDKLGMTYPHTDKGKASFTKGWLNEHTEEFPQLIAKSRSVNKAYSNFIDGIMKYVTKEGRVHSHINQVRSDDRGTVSGRFSMNSPAMQTIPARDPYLGPLLRSLFLPEEGELWVSIDFSQQEPRILVHYAKIFSDYLKVDLPGVEEFLEQYRNDPTTDFHQMVADMAGIPRKQAKTCIAEGELVLTNKGLVPIEQVLVEHLVWDGLGWVQHEGLIYKGEKEVIEYDGLWATPDHKVWLRDGRTVSLGKAARELERLATTGRGGQEVRFMDGDQRRDSATKRTHLRSCSMQMRQRGLEVFRKLAAGAFRPVQVLLPTEVSRDDSRRKKVVSSMRKRLLPLWEPCRQSLSGLWCSWNTVPIQIPEGHVKAFAGTSTRTGVGPKGNRSHQQRRPLRAGQHTPRDGNGEQPEQAEYPVGHLPKATGVSEPLVASNQNRSPLLRFWPCKGTGSASGGLGPRPNPHVPKKRSTKVYDLHNAGPRHRFTVSGRLVSNCGLGMIYGLGKANLALQLELPPEEAAELIAQFHDGVPFVKRLTQGVQKHLEDPRSKGIVRSLLGRTCHFDLYEPSSYGSHKAMPHEEAVQHYGPHTRLKRAYTYRGLNRIIQASAADMTKKAMVDCFVEKGKIPLLQVHDELVFSLKNIAEAEELREIMINAMPLEVPNVCDIEIGPNWGEVVEI
jgi:DNA polymerase I-like protein with 3'-5' exonuclease and polymerase domains